MSGNVVPQKGPTMEEVYDSQGNGELKEDKIYHPKHKYNLPGAKQVTGFHKIPNPELKMYVYPHLAGEEEVPIPGYYTMFNAYERDHYALT